ncbi:T9SS type A sorting domain-containing protein [Gaetbulibacter aquiaggeris]|uniref:T9SS type A sorting domain-containing protein n=1 Tax=Gaetbulibacter aquiaggeris TaxID=1735373 RepID=A0ABW7MW10_9FLAO
MFSLLGNNILKAQQSNGVFQYNDELEGHHCDDAGCYGYCTNSYMENSLSANLSSPSSTLENSVRGWMGKLLQIKPDINIREMSIPGTHDSGAQWGGPPAETQSWDIFQQLDGGIRYFDIRLKPNPDDPNNSLAVYHGDYPQGYDTDCYGAVGVSCDRLTLTQILTWMKDFLAINKDEAILMRILYEVGLTDSNPTDAQKTKFSEILEKILFKETNGIDEIQINGANSDQLLFPIYNIIPPGQHYFGTVLPDLKDLRGKIWIDRVLGADNARTPIQQYSPTNGRVKLQNAYEESASNLGDAVVAAIKEAPTHISNGSWVQNWTNGINLTVPAAPVPNDVASWVNKRTFHALNELGSNRPVGTIVMDFPGEGLIYRIIKTNFVYEKLVDLTVGIDCYHSVWEGGATGSRINVKLYNGGFLMGEVDKVPGCNGLGDSYFQIKKVMRAMPQDYTHFIVENLNPDEGDGFGVDEIYISQTRYGLNCYDGGVPDDLFETWGVDAGGVWCVGVDGDNEYGSNAASGACRKSWSFFSGGATHQGNSSAPATFTEELNYYTQGCFPLEEQVFTVKNQPSIRPFPVAYCGPNAPPVIFEKDTTLTASYTLSMGNRMIVNSGVVLTIPRGMVLTIESKSSLTNFGTIVNLGQILIRENATAENKPAGIINSPGLYINIGETLNEGAIYSPIGYYGRGKGGKQTLINPVETAFFLGTDIEGGQSICEDWLKTEGIYGGGVWSSATNTCTIDNFLIKEDRSLIVNEGVTLKINSTLFNNGRIDNRGTINNDNGTINQCGEYKGIDPSDPNSLPLVCLESEEQATCQQLGGQWNEVTQTCTLDGNPTILFGTTLTINPGVTYSIRGDGILTNEGSIVNYGNILNSNRIINTLDADIINYGEFIMQLDSDFGPVLVNEGNLRNNGIFRNVYDYNGGVEGLGYFVNQCGGVIENIIPFGVIYEAFPESIPPVAIANDFTILLDSTGNSEPISSLDIDNGSSDNCGIDSMSLSQTVFDCSNVGPNTVILSVTDNSGNLATDSFVVFVEDYFSPVIISKSEFLTLRLDNTGHASISTEDIDNGSSDNCGIKSMSLSQSDFDCSNIGANTVIFTVTDNSGNTSSLAIAVIVEDITHPLTVIQPGCDNEAGSIEIGVINENETYSFDNGATFQAGNSMSGLIAGDYNIVIKSPEGCTANITVILDESSTPAQPVISSEGSDPDLQILTADSAFAYGYQWYKDGEPITGATFKSLEVSELGSYTVVALSEYGCVSEASIAYIVSSLGTTVDFNSLDFRLYPNPVSDAFTVSFGNNPGNKIVTIYGLTGVQLDRQEVSGNYAKFTVKEYSSGIYFVKIVSGVSVRTTRFIKQ